MLIASFIYNLTRPIGPNQLGHNEFIIHKTATYLLSRECIRAQVMRLPGPSMMAVQMQMQSNLHAGETVKKK